MTNLFLVDFQGGVTVTTVTVTVTVVLNLENLDVLTLENLDVLNLENLGGLLQEEEMSVMNAPIQEKAQEEELNVLDPVEAIEAIKVIGNVVFPLGVLLEVYLDLRNQ
jgi:hypothetical protein